MKSRLTANFVRTATAERGAPRTYFWDASKPGFGLMVTATGHKSYVIQYRLNGQTKRRTLDASNVTLEQARAEASSDLGLVARGADPEAERRKSVEDPSNTLRFIAAEYVKREGRRVRTMADRKKALERLVFPTLGDKQIDAISRTDVARLLDKIEDNNGSRWRTGCWPICAGCFLGTKRGRNSARPSSGVWPRQNPKSGHGREPYRMLSCALYGRRQRIGQGHSHIFCNLFC